MKVSINKKSSNIFSISFYYIKQLFQTKENNQQDLIDSLNSKRKEQLTIVSTLKQKLLDLEQSEVEEIGELDFERSLIIGELDSENEQLRKVRFKRQNNFSFSE